MRLLTKQFDTDILSRKNIHILWSRSVLYQILKVPGNTSYGSIKVRKQKVSLSGKRFVLLGEGKCCTKVAAQDFADFHSFFKKQFRSIEMKENILCRDE